MPKFPPRQPGEILTMCDGYRPIRDANKLLKAHGLVLRTRGSRAELGDQAYLRLERLPGKALCADLGPSKAVP